MAELGLGLSSGWGSVRTKVQVSSRKVRIKVQVTVRVGSRVRVFRLGSILP